MHPPVAAPSPIDAAKGHRSSLSHPLTMPATARPPLHTEAAPSCHTPLQRFKVKSTPPPAAQLHHCHAALPIMTNPFPHRAPPPKPAQHRSGKPCDPDRPMPFAGNHHHRYCPHPGYGRVELAEPVSTHNPNHLNGKVMGKLPEICRKTRFAEIRQKSPYFYSRLHSTEPDRTSDTAECRI